MYHYSLNGYGSMSADSIRLPAYRKALQQAMRPGAVVGDIGTGPGVMAVIACRLGAGHVYAIEPNDAIQVAREVAAANGVEDRITFIQGCTDLLTPPRRCDVLVSDLHGCLPLYERHIPTIIDARERWLAPHGVLIPQRDVLQGALVESEKTYAEFSGPWRKLGDDLNMEAIRARTIHSYGKCHLQPADLRSAPQHWAELDYRTITDANVAGGLRFTVERSGPLHGLALWFDAELWAGIGFSNAPSAPKLVYGQCFFPFQEPLPAEAGETVSVFLRASLVGEDYVWQWNTEWTPADPARGASIRYQQSSFFGSALSPDRLRRSEKRHRPQLNAEGRLERLVLEGMNGELSLEELSQRLVAADPQRFADPRRALAFVQDLSIRFSE